MAKPVHKDSNDYSSSSLDFSYFLLLNRVFNKASLSIIIQSHHSQTNRVQRRGKEFLDLARSYPRLRGKVTKADFLI